MPRRVASDGGAALVAVRAELELLVEKRLVEPFTLEERDRYFDLTDREKELLLRPVEGHG